MDGSADERTHKQSQCLRNLGIIEDTAAVPSFRVGHELAIHDSHIH